MRNLTSGRVMWGLVLTVLGVIWLLNELNVTGIDLEWLISHYWPVILVYFGAVGVGEALGRGTGSERQGLLWGSVVVNLVVAGAGVILLGNANNWFYVDLSWIWKALVPLMVVVVGATLLIGGVKRPGARTYWAVMGGSKEKRTSWDDLALVALMGGTDLDFSHAGLPDRDVQLDLYMVMGGAEIKVPEGVQVTCEWTGVMGGVEVFGHSKGTIVDHKEFSTQGTGTGPRLHIRAVTVMGGAKVVQVPDRAQYVS